MQKLHNYINGKLIPPEGGAYIDNYNPATGKVYSLIPDSDERDVNIAVEAAERAFLQWAKTPVQQRSDLLMKISQLIEKNLESLARAESDDNGKPVWLAKKVDIPRAASNFSFFATGILHFASEAHSMEDTALNYTLRNPVGIVGCISPWNLPLYLFTWKIAPALAAGNCVVAKPSEITPMTAFILSELCMQAGLPPGVLNIVHGYGSKAGTAIVAHPSVSAVSFTGGTKTGAEIARIAAPMFKKLSLELGGKNPNIVFADCNFDLALQTSVQAAFTNQGEICLCGSRIFVERKIYNKFRDEFVARVKNLKVGDPSPPSVPPKAGDIKRVEEADRLQLLRRGDNLQQGAIVSKQHLEKVLSYIELAEQEGGKILTGGHRIFMDGELKDGWYIEPTVIEGLSHQCRTNQEEIFGPVVTLTPFDSEEEVLKMANNTPYGLAAILFTENLTCAHRVSARLQAGIVWVNCWLLRDLRTPFGGMKSSGVGREGGWEALRFFTEAKNVCIKLMTDI